MKGNRKFYIALHGEVHEVSREVYQAYYQGKRKEKYIYEQDIIFVLFNAKYSHLIYLQNARRARI